jgi:hypothetical protein
MKRTATLLAITGLALSINPENYQDNEEFAPILARAGIWAATHPQQVAKGVEVGIKAAPAVIGGAKKGIDWVNHHILHDDENDDELFAPIVARAGIWAATHPQQIAKGIEVGVKAAPTVIAGAKKGYDWVKNHVHDDEDNELFAPIVARAGIWAATHPQQIAKGVEVGIKAAPAVIGGAKKGIDWVNHHILHDDEVVGDDELFAPIVARAGIWAATHPQQIAKGIEVGIKAAPAVIGGIKKGSSWVNNHIFHDDEDMEDDELFAPIVARAGIWAATHPQQIAKGVEVGIKAAPAVIGGAKKGIDWVNHHILHDDEVVGDDELFAPIVARAGIWAATHPQQIAKGIEVGVKAAPTVIAGAKKGYDWVKNHVHDDEDNELFAQEHVKPKNNGQKLRRDHHQVEKPDLEQLGDLIKEGKKFRGGRNHHRSE